MLRYVLGLLLLATNFASAQPLFDSWYLEGSRHYARLYPTLTEETARTAVTTWSRGQGNQTQATYGGVHLVAFNDNNVYVGATGLGAHVMGPWYGNPQKTQLFPNYPAGRATYFRITRTPVIPTTKSLTGLGAIGIFVDGVSMFDSRDAFSYSNAQGSDQSGNQGDGVWNSDAYVNESVTFDAANAHQAGSQYHYHANPPGLRHLLGDNVNHDPVSNRYTEGATPARHSPILGWVLDGLPIYGPYAYSDSMNTNSPITRMRTGYRLRNITVRQTLPAWAARAQNRSEQLSANLFGPTIAAEALGHYLEDNEYLGDVGFILGVDFDLNEHNVRFCRTPEFPNGTWAYFVNISSDGTPVFPYNIGRSYYGTPNGGSINSLPGNVTVHATGGPESRPRFNGVTRDAGTGDVTLVWDGVEGGRYRVESTTNFSTWTPLTSVESATVIDRAAGLGPQKFYRTIVDSVDAFSSAGFRDTIPAHSLATISVTLNGSAPADLGTGPTSVNFNGASALFVSRPSQNVITLRVPDGLVAGNYPVAVTFPGGASLTGTHQVVAGNNILLLIVDDWGIDSSPIDNLGGPNLPVMPNLTSLAGSGVRFRNAYVQAQCSPTRAAILTGRHAFRTGIGSPGGVDLAAAEVTLADALVANGYAAGSVGKWHLGSGNTGPRDRGGWQYFAGAQGNLTNYHSWSKITINGAAAPVVTGSTTYATTENTTDAINWINAQGGNDWMCWVAYNAPHSPFDAAPAVVAGQNNPYANINNNRRRYESMLWAIDAEIGRLLGSVDLNSTTVIIVGDNGTPGGVIQTPFSNAHSKATLYDGGTHVPLIIAGKAVQSVGTTSDALVSAVDVYSTILEIAGINPASLGVTLDSKSLLPIINGGTDNADRFAVIEAFGVDTNPGRAIRDGDYKLIIHDDPLITTDTAVLELYHLPTDQNETNNLLAGTLTAAQQTAHNNLLARNVALGGAFNNTPAQSVTFYAQLDPNANSPRVPNLTRNDNGNIVNVNPNSVTVGGVAATFIAREDQNGTPSQFVVKAEIEPGAANLQSGQSYPIVVSFPGQTPRVFTALNQFMAP
ncbi:MAG: sulfatase-like hydrolase/transferase [Limisphaerales bacterium]